ncbi:MAG: TerB family tellurite resistance protein [Lachnospiraceae bacterium]|nr:TerB family tellurite resistance protein [Lachnospiraceae bacterium]
MYLSLLNREQKSLFLELELYMSKIDSNFSEEEKIIINTHCLEMHIDNNNYECTMPLDLVISRIQKEFGDKEKRIVFLELVATIMADNVYHDAEKELLNKLQELLEFDSASTKIVFDIINSIKESYKKCAHFVMEG